MVGVSSRFDDLFFKLLGKSSTLTGRTFIWEVMGDQISRHFWQGVGYGGFWVGLMGGAAEVTRLVQWGYPGQSHNGFIDVLNELGFVGLGFLVYFLICHIRQVYRLATKGSPVFVHVLIVAAAIFLNITEATLIRATHIWWILVVLSYFDVRYTLIGSKRG